MPALRRLEPPREPAARNPLREPAERELLRELPARDVVRLLRALVPRDPPPLRELDLRDSLARLRSLLRPLPLARPRALDDFFAWASRPRSDFLAAVREPPLLVRELRDERLPEELLDDRDEPVSDFRDEELLPREADFLLWERPPLLLPLPREARDLPPDCCAVSRVTSLLKLLRSPPAVVS